MSKPHAIGINAARPSSRMPPRRLAKKLENAYAAAKIATVCVVRAEERRQKLRLLGCSTRFSLPQNKLLFDAAWLEGAPGLKPSTGT